VRAERPGELAPRGCDVDGDDPRAHDHGELRGRQPHGALAEDGDRLAALQVDALERPPGGPRATRDRRAGQNESESGSGTSVETGTFMYLAWPPWPPEPYTTVPARHICVRPARQCLQVPQPS
jgi:hypothetical protein